VGRHCICIYGRSSDQAGEVEIVEEGLRNVSGFAGLTGAAFFVGDVARGVLVGDLDPDDGLTVD
jgi:alpha-D-ribose 1-methylphosphonate 5-triphosphate synthase subunit PhnG